MYWLGQLNKGKSNERDIISGNYDVFYFLRVAKNTYKFFGRVTLASFDLEERGLSSRMIFEMTEYAEYKHRILLDWNEIPQTVSSIEVQTSAVRTTEVRISQNRYRADALEYWGNQCAITGVHEKSLLIVGHIKPWRYSNNIERMDPANSIILSPTFDKLFDKGSIACFAT